MNILEQKNIRSPAGKDDICAKFTIDDTGSPYVLHDVAEENQEYTLSFWCYSETDGEITAGGLDMSTSTEWTRYVVTFISDSVDVPIYFNIAGTYHIYNAQLEIGCKATDFALNPADTELSLAELTVIVESHTTEFTVMDGKIAALVAEDVSIRGEYDTLVSRTTEMQADLDGITTRVSLTESELGTVSTVANQTAEKFTWIVSSGTDKTNFTLTDRTAELIAETISLNGNVKVNGDMIVDGSITADKIDVADLFAQDITATGTITGVNLVGATGNFSGNITAATLVVDNKISMNTAYGTTGKLFSTGESIDLENVLWVDFDQIFSDIKFMSGYVDFHGEVYVEKGISVGETIGAEGIIRSEEAVSAGGMASIDVDSEGGSLNITSAFGNLWHIDSPLENLRFVSQTDGAVLMELGRYGGLMLYNGCLELFHSTPCIDFHFGYSSSDFTSRIIEYKAGFLRVEAALYILDYSGTYRRPVTSANGEENQVVMLSTSTSTKLSITGSWGDASTYTAKTITVSSSDIRLKESVEPSTVDALSLINKIKIRQFNWKDSGEHQNIGFIADELEELDKELAVGGGYTEDGFMDVKSVNDFYLLGYLTKGIQELCSVQGEHTDRILAAEARQDEQQILIEQLMDENAKLKKRVAQLEEQQAA